MTPLATIRSGLDAYGATTTTRVRAVAGGYEIETVREFYSRDGGRTDYETATAFCPGFDGGVAEPTPVCLDATPLLTDAERAALKARLAVIEAARCEAA